MLNFDFFHRLYDFLRKMFLILYSIKWPSFIASLSLLLEILVIMFITIVSQPGYDAINFEINLVVLIRPFFEMAKNSRQKFKYLENQKGF